MARDAAADAQRMKDLEERIRAPSVWGRLPCGVRFEDLQDRRYEEAISFLKKHYLNEEIPYRSMKIAEDKEGVDEFAHNARIWLKDKMSIACVKEGSDKIVGVLILRIQEQAAFSRTFSRVKLTYNPKYAAVVTYYRAVEKPADVFAQYDVRRYFKIYALALKPRYRHRGIAKELLNAAMAMCRAAFVPALAGIFTTGRGQQIATELGFQKLHEIYYTKYLVDDKIVFLDIGAGNYGAALMAHRVPFVEEPAVVGKVQSSRFSLAAPAGDDDGETK